MVKGPVYMQLIDLGILAFVKALAIGLIRGFS